MDTDKMMTYETFTMDDEKLTVITQHNRIGSSDKYSNWYKSIGLNSAIYII